MIGSPCQVGLTVHDGRDTLPAVALPPDLGKRFRAAREYAGLSNANEVAEELGWKPTNYGRLERGERTLRDWEADALLPRMAALCGVPVGWFTEPWGATAAPTQAGPDEEPEWVGELRDQVEFLMGVIRRVHPEAAAAVATELTGDDESTRAQPEPVSTAATATARRRRAG